MDIVKELVSYLDSLSGLTTIIGSGNVFADEAPQDKKYPFVVITLDGEETNPHLNGDGDLYVANVSIECFNRKDRSVIVAMKEVIRKALFTYQSKAMGELYIFSSNLVDSQVISRVISDGGEKMCKVYYMSFDIGYKSNDPATGGL